MVDFFCTDNPERDAERYSDIMYEADKKMRAESPKCMCCEKPVGEVGDEYYSVDDFYICEDCISDFRHSIYEW